MRVTEDKQDRKKKTRSNSGSWGWRKRMKDSHNNKPRLYKRVNFDRNVCVVVQYPWNLERFTSSAMKLGPFIGKCNPEPFRGTNIYIKLKQIKFLDNLVITFTVLRKRTCDWNSFCNTVLQHSMQHDHYLYQATQISFTSEQCRTR
jgi:hypothetical protein